MDWDTGRDGTVLGAGTKGLIRSRGVGKWCLTCENYEGTKI